MIIVTGFMRVDAAQRDAFVDNAAGVMAASRAEAGCDAYAMTADPIESDIVLITEEWQSPEAIAEHLASDHFAEFGASLGDFAITEVKVMQHEVSASSQLM